MTIAGAQRLKAELQQLKTVERPTIVRAIGEARLHGDISENAEYHAAKERQGFIEARIRDIESKLGNAQIIDVTVVNAGGKVVFGATVHLVDVKDGSEARYQIVGEDEADIKSGLLSIGSPIERDVRSSICSASSWRIDWRPAPCRSVGSRWRTRRTRLMTTS